MREQLQRAWRQIQSGGSASVSFEVDGALYRRNFHQKERLILLGGGHIAQPLCKYGADLGFSVTVADDRPSFANALRFPEAQAVICDTFPNVLRSIGLHERDYVAVITRGHRYDAGCLRNILAGPFPHYLGMIGSKRRVAELLRVMEQEGFPRAALDRIHAPIGLPINALTAKEIAVSIVAEIIQCRRQEQPRRSQSTTLVMEDIDLPLLGFLAREDKRKTVLIVYETSGSTPVKAGAIMAVDQDLQTAGTIGGGCSEHAVLMDAYRLVGSGQRKAVTVDMSGDVAEEDGMVCGGQMKVLIADLG